MDSTCGPRRAGRRSPSPPASLPPTGRRDAEAGQAGVAAGVRVADQAHEVLDAAGPRVGRDRQHGQRGEQQRVQAMAGEGVPVGGDQRVAVRGQGGFVQRRHRRRRAVRAGQGHRHDHAVEEALHIRAGDGRHHLRDIHAGFIAFQVRGQIGLRLVQADRHADGRVGLGQSRRLQRDEFHAGGALVQRGPRDAFHFRFQPGPETRRQAQPQAGDGQRLRRLVLARQDRVQQRDVFHAGRQRSRRVAGMRDRRDAGAVIAAHAGTEAGHAVERGRQAHRGAGIRAQRGGRQTRATAAPLPEDEPPAMRLGS